MSNQFSTTVSAESTSLNEHMVINLIWGEVVEILGNISIVDLEGNEINLNSNEVWSYSLLEVNENDERLDLLPPSQIKKINGLTYCPAQVHPDILEVFYKRVICLFPEELSNIAGFVCSEAMDDAIKLLNIGDSTFSQNRLDWRYFLEKNFYISSIQWAEFDSSVNILNKFLQGILNGYRNWRFTGNQKKVTDLFENIVSAMISKLNHIELMRKVYLGSIDISAAKFVFAKTTR